jgi:hypothetical protein
LLGAAAHPDFEDRHAPPQPGRSLNERNVFRNAPWSLTTARRTNEFIVVNNYLVDACRRVGVLFRLCCRQSEASKPSAECGDKGWCSTQDVGMMLYSSEEEHGKRGRRGTRRKHDVEWNMAFALGQILWSFRRKWLSPTVIHTSSDAPSEKSREEF